MESSYLLHHLVKSSYLIHYLVESSYLFHHLVESSYLLHHLVESSYLLHHLLTVQFLQRLPEGGRGKAEEDIIEKAEEDEKGDSAWLAVGEDGLAGRVIV